jgi:hypothetical protein
MSNDWNVYFTGSESAVNAANAQINANCGFPDACTQGWAVPMQAYEQDFWFILMPPPDGYMTKCGSWTQDEMIAGVTGVVEQQGQSNWWPPGPFPPETK